MSFRKKYFHITLLIGAIFLSLSFSVPLHAGEVELMEEPDLVILENKPWVSTKEGYLHKSIIGKSRKSGMPFELVFLKFNPYKFQLKVRHFSNFSDRPEYLGYYYGKEKNAVAAINGGYFDPKGNHLGYLMIDHKPISKKIATHPIYSGVVLPDKKQLIFHRSDFKPNEVSNALQVGPLLIRNGKVNPGLKNTKSSHYRSGLGYEKSGMYVLFATNTNYGGVSWDDLVDVLQMSEFDFLNVINLDGGGSTQMLFQRDGEKVFYRGVTPVPTALVVERRTEGAGNP